MNNQQQQTSKFVNIAQQPSASTQQKQQPHLHMDPDKIARAPQISLLPNTRALTIPRPGTGLALGGPQQAVGGTTQVVSGGAMNNPAFAGAINLTISNGAINIKPQPGLVTQGRMDITSGQQQPMPTVIKTNITGGSAISKLPMMQQTAGHPGQAINLKMASALNFRVAAPGTLQAGRGQTMIGARPLLINSAQLRPVSSGSQMVAQNITQIGGQTLAHLNPQAFAHVMPQGAAGQAIAQGVMLPQGARFITPMPITTLGDTSKSTVRGQTPVNVKPSTVTMQGTCTPVVASIQQGGPLQGQTSPVAANFSLVSPISVGTSSAIMTGQPMVAYATTATLPQVSFHHNQPISVAASNLSIPMVAPSTITSSGTAVPLALMTKQTPIRPMSTIRLPTNYQVATTRPILSSPSAGSVVTMVTSAISQTTNPNTIVIKPDPPRKEAVIVSPVPSTRVTADAKKPGDDSDDDEDQTSGSDEDGEDEEGSEKIDDNEDFDAAAVMDWQDGIGSLPGSTLKFRVNEFGLMEVVPDVPDSTTPGQEIKSTDRITEDSNKSKNQDISDVKPNDEGISHCIQCGTYGTASEFSDNGQFCSVACSEQFQKNIEALAKPKRSLEKTPGKKKKRKLAAMDEATIAKVAKVEDDSGSEGKQSESSLSLPIKKTKGFSWPQYLEQEKVKGAPTKLFKEPYPTTKNSYKVGMRLEGIDIRHPSLYCVLSVSEVKGYRLRLHFDGYSECFDFWANADSPFIFPTGWSEKNYKKLQPPKGFTSENFSWSTYLKMSKFPAAPKSLFCNTQVTSVTPHGFRAGMKLEAVDKRNSSLTCVATVTDVLGDRILVHFDGWEDIYDYWCEPNSQYIHPVGWCQANGKPLSPPNDWTDISTFTWADYMKETKSQAVPARAFKNKNPNSFEVGMRVEVVDKRNPILIRVCSIVEVEQYSVKIHFDGWSDIYDYWVEDDCPDLHPPGWCHKTGHTLTQPITPRDLATSPSHGGCPTPGCRGIGHIKGARYTGHHSAFGCPYSQMNLVKDLTPPDRISNTRDSLESILCSSKVSPSEMSPEYKYLNCPTQGCNGAGHITGKYPAHHRLSGCPLAEGNKQKLQKISNLLNEGKPLFGKGSGRGRKKKKILTLIQKQRELEESIRAQGEDDEEEYPQYPQEENGYPEPNTLYTGIHQSVFMSGIMPTPGQDMPLCWEQHSKLLPGLDSYRAKEVAAWNVQQVSKFVGTLPGCTNLAGAFKEEQIDGEAFLLLNQADIVKILNVKLGPALKIYNSILIFKNNMEM